MITLFTRVKKIFFNNLSILFTAVRNVTVLAVIIIGFLFVNHSASKHRQGKVIQTVFKDPIFPYVKNYYKRHMMKTCIFLIKHKQEFVPGRRI